MGIIQELNFADNLAGMELKEIVAILNGVREDLKEAGLYFATYSDDEHLIIIGEDTQELLIDVQQAFVLDVKVTRTYGGLIFEQDTDTGISPTRDESYYIIKADLNLIKVDYPAMHQLETTFKSINIEILNQGKKVGAIVFNKDNIKY
jgi:hypothetical protein